MAHEGARLIRDDDIRCGAEDLIPSALRLPRLLQLASATLPVGGFTYSQGLEWAVEAGWVRDEDGFRRWQRQQMTHTLAHFDWPLLQRLYHACERHDASALRQWRDLLLAGRETSELRAEERQRGQAFIRILAGWGFTAELDADWRDALADSQLCGMAWLGPRWAIPLPELALAYGYSWLEGAVMAGVKLVPFGQQSAQNLLLELGAQLTQLLPAALTLNDDEIGAGLPLAAIASACHETQYTRLFRS
ncbi:Urease accessory protein UreF [Brenneria goodwinii]|uniref:Urease accessory protein UreF n=1 Tax=Brenneria goodwinii TaxID=1109412 RepID=A0A0G4JUA6_9GAMM|nr:Urease accessory protein UreF [Brenneria goodwinii]